MHEEPKQILPESFKVLSIFNMVIFDLTAPVDIGLSRFSFLPDSHHIAPLECLHYIVYRGDTLLDAWGNKCERGAMIR